MDQTEARAEALAQLEPVAYLILFEGAGKLLEFTKVNYLHGAKIEHIPLYTLVDATIIKIILPQLYAIIDRLLDGNPDKGLIIEARRILPREYKHSFEKPKEKNYG